MIAPSNNLKIPKNVIFHVFRGVIPLNIPGLLISFIEVFTISNINLWKRRCKFTSLRKCFRRRKLLISSNEMGPLVWQLPQKSHLPIGFYKHINNIHLLLSTDMLCRVQSCESDSNYLPLLVVQTTCSFIDEK